MRSVLEMLIRKPVSPRSHEEHEAIVLNPGILRRSEPALNLEGPLRALRGFVVNHSSLAAWSAMTRSRLAVLRSASTIIFANALNVTFGSQPSVLRALVASP